MDGCPVFFVHAVNQISATILKIKIIIINYPPSFLSLANFQFISHTSGCKFSRKLKGQGQCSLRADEIKLWLTPSAKQRRNPCSGLPAVNPDLSTRHDWPVKKSLSFVCRDRQSG